MLIGRKGHPRLRSELTATQFARLDHIVVSLHGGDFATPVDDALAALGLGRNVVLSAASFLFVPGLVARSDLVALVPQRLVADRRDDLRVVECPIPVQRFEVGMLWHERSEWHAGHRWAPDTLEKMAVEGTRGP